ncbi:MFS transporter [Paenibacillus thermotolerans]|uniref:MFS transporter n=1 Tax=Paenibacillus thermotolerans TaxID=3027807 RepID=UPI002367B74F|nr:MULTISPECIES: MFS transporter [unclassified Paenibacillus]
MTRLLFSFKYPKQMAALCMISLLAMAGYSFLWPLTSIYVTEVLGKPLTTAGMVLSVEACAAIVGGFAGGMLTDRFGGKIIMLVSACGIFISSATLAAYGQWIVFITAFAVMNCLIGAMLTALQTSVGSVWPEGGKSGFQLTYLFQNIGVAAGTAIGGIVSSVSFTYSFGLNAMFFLLGALLIFTGVKGKRPEKREKEAEHAGGGEARQGGGARTAILLMLGSGLTLTLMSYIQWQTTIPVLMKEIGYDRPLYSLLWTINGCLVILLQPFNMLLGKLISNERFHFWLGQGMLIASFMMLLGGDAYWRFVAAMVLATIGEIIIWPAIPALASRIAPPDRRGFYQGVISTFNYSGRLIGPIAGTFAFQYWGARAMLVMLVLFYIIALINFSLCLYMQRNRRVPAGDIQPSAP